MDKYYYFFERKDNKKVLIKNNEIITLSIKYISKFNNKFKITGLCIGKR